jgi:hypothetical protein
MRTRPLGEKDLAKKLEYSVRKRYGLDILAQRRAEAVENCKYEGPVAFAKEADSPDEYGNVTRCMTPAQALAECVMKQLSRTSIKTVSQVYVAVRYDWGTVTIRTIHRVLKRFILQGKVVNYKKGPLNGCYILADSPLLKSPDGRAFILEMLEDAQES